MKSIVTTWDAREFLTQENSEKTCKFNHLKKEKKNTMEENEVAAENNEEEIEFLSLALSSLGELVRRFHEYF